MAKAPTLQIFISHDVRDAELAHHLKQLLVAASGGLFNVFYASDKHADGGIKYGHAWYASTTNEVKRSVAVISLLTPHSRERPWLLFEAGLALGCGKTLHGITFKVKADELGASPFSQYQFCEYDTQLTAFVRQLLTNNIAGCDPDAFVIDACVKRFLEQTAAIVSRFEHVTTPTLEQLLENVQSLLTSRQLSTYYVGQYPEFFEMQVCDNIARAKTSVLIACDFPAYGFFTNQELYRKYRDVLFDRYASICASKAVAQLTPQEFCMVVPVPEIRRHTIEALFPVEQFEAARKINNYAQGLAALAEYLGLPPLETSQEFYDAIDKVNTDEINGFPFKVVETHEQIPVFIWSVDTTRATFSIPTSLPGEAGIEHSFNTTDKTLAKGLESIVLRYVRDELSGGSRAEHTK